MHVQTFGRLTICASTFNIDYHITKLKYLGKKNDSGKIVSKIQSFH